MLTIQDVLRELEEEAKTTRRTLEAVPEDQLGWRPHEKSMSMGELTMHIARLPAAIAGLASRSEFDVSTPIPLPSASSVAELLSTLDQSLEEARSLLGGIDDSMMPKPWRMMAGDREVFAIPRAALIRSVMLNHWYHHRGQLTVYLRLTGARVPSVYGPSADENPLSM
jgi:uncharacterized damage-inducible protein DinB